MAAEVVSRTSPRLIAAGIATALVARVWLGIGTGALISAADGVVVLIGVVMIGPVEWLVHRHLFHASETSRRARWLGTGRRHRRHHDQPDDLEWLLLDRRGAIVLLIATAGLAALWGLPVAAALGEDLWATWLSAVVVAWLALAHYEWTHLLAHVAYRPQSNRYRTLTRRHRYHHYRDEGRWLGVTSNLGDHLFATAVPTTPRTPDHER